VFRRPLAEVGLETTIVQPPVLESPFYAVPTPPPPVKLVATTGNAVLADPKDPAQLPAFTRAIGEQIPRDFRWVTIAGEFDVAQWRKRLGEPGSDPQFSKMPSEWWRDRMLLVHVVMERQKRDARTGEWGPVEQIDSLPNAVVNFPPQPRRFTQAETRDLLDKLTLEQREIARPQFLTLASGSWNPPGGAQDARPALTPEQEAKVADLRRQLQDALKSMAPLERQLAEQAKLSTPQAAQRMQALQAQLAPLVQRRADIQRQIDEITHEPSAPAAAHSPTSAPPSGPPSGPPVPPGSPGWAGPGPAAGPGHAADVPPTQLPGQRPGPESRSPATALDATSDRMTFWRHDVSVEPGAEYRYRMRVNVLNPLFQRTGVNREQQNEHFHKKELESEFSEWSEPVVIEPEFYYFVVNASKQAGGAEVEVYRVFDGKWRRQAFQVRPGDPVGNAVSIRINDKDQALPMRVDALVVDVEFEVPIPGAALGARTSKIVLYDERQGLLQERLVEFDRGNPNRVRLQNLAQSN
jgi:hypothetical protein